MDTSHKHTAILKVNYAPIEQYADAKDMQEGPWTDLYAVAAVVHGCICNEPPLPATFRAVRDRMPPFAQVAQTAQTHFNQAYTEGFVRAVEHGLVIEPTERTASVEVFAHDLGMKAPPDLARFNWRQALGESVTLTEAGDDPEPVHTEALTTQPASGFADTVFQPTTFDQSQTVKVRAKSDRGGKSRSAHVPRVSKKTRTPVWAWLLPIAVLVAVAGWYWKHSTAISPAVPAAVVSPTEAPALAPAASPVSAAGDVSKPVVSNASVTPRASSVAKAPPVAAMQPPAGKTPLVKPVPRSEAKPADEKPVATVKDPTSICAEASVWTRTMCVYRECQKPEFYNLPVCVADRKHWDEQNKGRN